MRGTSHDLGPIGGQPLDVLRMLPGMGEGMAELRVGEAAGVVGGRQGGEGWITARELEQRGAHRPSFPGPPPMV